jgi:hypothetical protein
MGMGVWGVEREKKIKVLSPNPLIQKALSLFHVLFTATDARTIKSDGFWLCVGVF